MPRLFFSLLVSTLFLPSTACADTLTGVWKLTFFPPGQGVTYWHLKFASVDGKPTGSVLFGEANVPATTFGDMSVRDGLVRFTLLVQDQTFSFEGKLPTKDANTVFGSLIAGGQPFRAVLQLTPITNATTRLEAAREIVSRAPDSPDVFEAVQTLFSEASKSKATSSEVNAWGDAALKTAAEYGPLWHQTVSLRLAKTLAEQEGYAAAALDLARRHEKLLPPDAPPGERVRAYELIAQLLSKTGKADEATELRSRVAALEGQVYANYFKSTPPFEVKPFAGRTGAGTRRVLLEGFTSCEAPPCIGSDLGLVGVLKTFAPTDVVVLQYHLHIPSSDPLGCADADARVKYYAVDGTPSVYFNGAYGPKGGGPAEAGEIKFGQYRDVIVPLLEGKAKATISATARWTGSKIDVSTTVTDLESPGEKVRLRLALVEDWVRHRGGNGVVFHHKIARGFVGGPVGLPLPKKSNTTQAQLDLDELRTKTTSYLDEVAKKAPFSAGVRPLTLRNLSIVAFVQNDDTREVLHAVEIPVADGEK